MIPHLKKQGTATQLIVHDKPFLVLGGELGNSSASDLAYMEAIWSKAVALNMNTVLAPVYWELLEPEEGQFDFALVDSLIEGARKHDLSLVLLWFGAWKNSMSCYARQRKNTFKLRIERMNAEAGVYAYTPASVSKKQLYA